MSERHVLLTGFPGFIARRLVRKLLQVDDTLRMTLLVEAAQAKHAEGVLQKMGTRDLTDVELASRVRTVTGDITAMDVGLSGSEFKAVTENATEIFHLAAVHAVDADKERATAANVQGTANMIALARSTRKLERFVHFSSAYVSGDRTGVIMEDELESNQMFRNHYEETKHQAEVLVKRAAQQLPMTIVRPAGVVGDSITGEVDRFDSVYNIGMLLVASPVSFAIPFAGEGRAPLNVVPVDYLVDAVNAIVTVPETLGKTFHVVDPNPLSTRRVYEAVAERAGRKLPRYNVSPNLTKALLRIPGLERFAPVSHQAIDYLNHMAFYNSRNTEDALGATGIRCPHFEDYVDNLMQYVRDYFEHAGRWNDQGKR